jgi:Tol biopolymer transport system component
MTIFRLSALVIVVVVVGVALTPAVGARQQEPGVLLRAAIEKEDAAGDLEGAMALYRQIITANGRNRAVTARALLRLAGCYEKLGQTEAEKTYRQLIADYADQTAEVALARQKLAALTRALATESGIVARQVWSGPEVDFSGRPSPDGRYLSYSHPTGNLAIRELATGETRQITKDASLWTAEGWAGWSLFSPDGRQVVYEWGKWDSWLRLSSVDGSLTRVLLPVKRDWWIVPCDWSSDGRSILVHYYPAGGREPSQIAVLAVADGSLRVVKRLDPGQPVRNRNMWFSPDAQYILHDVLPSRDRNSRDIAVVAVDGTLEWPLIEDPSDDYVLGWSPTGRSVVFASNRSGAYGIWEISVSKGRPDGEARLLKRDIGPIRPLGLTRDGTLFFAQAGSMMGQDLDIYGANIDLVQGTLGEPRLAVQGYRGLNSMPDWSPDGTYLAYVSGRPASKSYVVSIRDEGTGTVREIHPELIELSHFDIRWSPDGRSLLALGQDREKQSGVFVIDANTGDVRPLFRRETVNSAFFGTQWMPDGRRIVYATNSRRPEVISTIVVRDTETGREQEILRMTDLRHIGFLALSPDGSMLAFTAFRLAGGADGGAPTSVALTVIPASGGDMRELTQVKIPELISSPVWSQDSRSLLFARASAADIMSLAESEVWQIPAAGGEARRLGAVPGLGNGRLSLHPDGRRFVYTRGERRFEIGAIENLLPKAAEQRQGR